MVEPTATKTVRFSKLVEEFGKPTLYLPLADPAKDSNFQHAVKKQRVLTIKQDPTSKQKDFGIVAFLPEKFVTYLVFPKSLESFANARVVGIKYDELAEGTLAPPPAAIPSKPRPSPKHSALPKKSEPKAKREPEPRIEPKPPPEPQPRTFLVRARVTATASIEQEISVKAMTKAEAKSKAEEQASSLQLPQPSVKTKILKVREGT
jgi:hypothetical protein